MSGRRLTLDDSVIDAGNISGNLRLVDPVKQATPNDPFGLLCYAYTGDSPLGTGLIYRPRRSVELKRPLPGQSPALLAAVLSKRGDQ